MRFAPTPSHRLAPALLAVPVLALLAGCGDALEPSEPALLVTSSYEDRVRVFDPADGSLRATLEADPRPAARDEPSGVASLPDGRWMLVLGGDEPSLWLYGPGDAQPETRIPLSGMRRASRVAVSPDGTRAVVTEHWLGDPGLPGQVAVVDLEAGRVQRRVSTCPGTYGAAWAPSGELIAISCALSDGVVVLDATTLERRYAFSTGTVGVESARSGGSSQPMGVAWSPASDRIYVSLMRAGQIGVFTVDGSMIGRVDVGGGPVDLTVTPRGRHVVAALRDEGTLVVVDTRSREARELRLRDAINPRAVALSPDGRTAYVAWEGSPEVAGGLLAVDLDAGEVLWTAETGPFTTGLAFRSTADLVQDDLPGS